MPVYGVQTMKDYLAQNTEQPRLNVIAAGADLVGSRSRSP